MGFMDSQPVGTIMPYLAAPGKQSGYMVRGDNDWYHVFPVPAASRWSCTCPGFTYNAACKHLRWVADYREEQRRLQAEEDECPACHGARYLTPRAIYFRPDGSVDDEPVRCLLCDGTGERADCDSELLERFPDRHKRADLPSQAELRELFR